MAHGICQTDAAVVIASPELVPRLGAVLNQATMLDAAFGYITMLDAAFSNTAMHDAGFSKTNMLDAAFNYKVIFTIGGKALLIF